MKTTTRTYLAGLTLLVASVCISQAQTAPAASSTAATRPANATGICKDGSYSTSSSKSGACRGHHGIQEWYAAASTAPSAAAPGATPAPPPARAAAPSPTTQARTQNQAAAQSAAQSSTPPATQSITPAATQSAPPATSPKKGGPRANLANTPVAPGGGPGLVWVNTASNVYHCQGTDFYGKTKAGAYMTEADAKAKGARGNRGKSCGN